MTDKPTSPAPSTKAARPAVRRTRRGQGTSAEPGIATRITKKVSKKGKYNAAGKRIDGRWFASNAEALRYEQLRALEQQGLIEDLECQPKFPVRLNNQLICNYLADFRYKVVDELGRTVRVVTEDVKGMVTDIYKLKRKLVIAAYDLEIIEVPAKDIAKWENRVA